MFYLFSFDARQMLNEQHRKDRGDEDFSGTFCARDVEGVNAHRKPNKDAVTLLLPQRLSLSLSLRAGHD